VALLAIVAMGIYSLKHPKQTHAESDPAENLPTGFVAVGTETVEDLYHKKYYQRIAKVFDGNLEAQFVCIPKKERMLTETIPDPETYYIMMDKVSVGLFQKFAADTGLGNDWMTAPDPEKPSKMIAVNDPNKLQNPVMNVRVNEAHEFAQRMISKDAKLPTIVQWDKAAGCYDKQRGEGPYKGDWHNGGVAVGRAFKDGPAPVGEAKADESIFKCRDMAGNGREWTRNGHGQKEAIVGKYKFQDSDRIITRGKRFTLDDPLKFSDLEDGIGENEKFSDRHPQLGFRVVIEPEG
jgi:formylglycine-generating enzyme required for sulfatase activity